MLFDLNQRSRNLLAGKHRSSLTFSGSRGRLTWEHSGFSVHHDVKVKARDAAGQQQLARYMMRAPFSLEKTEYKADSGMIVYRSKLHQGLKRNYQIMPGA